ncbi:MAG: hypothetical protein WA055_01325 [Candidatus Moraniibacteriota bacterium]
MNVDQKITLSSGLTVVIDTVFRKTKEGFACIAHYIHADTCFFAILGENGEIIL